MCANQATHAARVGATEIVTCEECIDGHDLTDVRELRPGERVEKDEYERVDTNPQHGWSP